MDAACAAAIQVTGATRPGPAREAYQDIYPLYHDLYPAPWSMFDAIAQTTLFGFDR